MEVSGYYGKKEELMVAKDKVMLSLLCLTSPPSNSDIRKSNYIKGVSLKCSFIYKFIINDMGLKDSDINTDKYRNFTIEYPVKDRKDLPEFSKGDLLECLIIDAKSSTTIGKNIHIVTRLISKNLILDYFKKAGFGENILNYIETFPLQELYIALAKNKINKLLETFINVPIDLLEKIESVTEKFFLEGGYFNYKKFFEVGVPFKEARGAIDIYAENAFKEISENPYKLLKVYGVSFRKADIRAIMCFNEDMWGTRRSSVAFLYTIKHIMGRGRYEAGSTAVSVEQIKYYGHLYLIGREGAKTAHSYIEDIMIAKGQASRWKILKEDVAGVLRLLFEGASIVKELDSEYLLKPESLPKDIIEKYLEKINKELKKEYTNDDFIDSKEVSDLVINELVLEKIAKGETVVKFPSSRRVATLGDFLMEMFILSNTSKIITKDVDSIQKEALTESYESIKPFLKNALTDKQEQAIYSFINNNFSILTGGPGTGKTYVISIIVEIAKKAGLSFKLLAPTGKAAKRMSELAENEPAQTIHMLLGFRGGSTFEVQSLDPYDFIIIDECSMVDPLLFGKFISVINPHTRVLLVGDPDQLPSIRAGNLLEDLIKTAQTYEVNFDINLVTKLTDIMRQKKIDGEFPAIVKISQDLMKAAKSQNHSLFLKDINSNIEGDISFPDTTLLVFKDTSSDKNENKEILRVFRSLLSKDSFTCDNMYFLHSKNLNKLQENMFFEGFKKGEWQVLTPFRIAGGGKLSSDQLNPIAREYINSDSFRKMEQWAEEMKDRFRKFHWRYKTDNMFSIGDRVLCNANIYKPNILGMKASELIETAKQLNFPVVNGDIGTIEEIYTPEVTSSFGDEISYSMEELPEVYRKKEFLKVYGPFYKIKFEGKDGYTWFNSYDAEKLSLGYIFTIHKSQGSEYDNLMIILNSRAKNFVTPKMLYTAITRAKKKLLLVISQSVLEEILLLARKDIRFTIIEHMNNLTKGIPFGKKSIEDYSEEFKDLMRVYLNWVVIIRNRYSKISGVPTQPYDFILKVMQSNVVGVNKEEEDDTDE